jgi:hypothetical protein
MTRNSPRKWDKFTAIPRGGRGRKELQNQITSRYMMLRRLQWQAPDEYVLQVKRIRIEDDVFGAMLDYRSAVGDEQRQKARAAMTEKVRDLDENLRQIDQLHLDKKQARLAALKRQSENLKRQMDALEGEINGLRGRMAEADSAEREASVNQRAEAYLKMQGFGGPRPALRPRGQGGSGGAGGAANPSAEPNGGGPAKGRRDTNDQ